MMLTEVCGNLNNFFADDADKRFGKFRIVGGSITPADFLQDGQFFRIVGSVFNDGVHRYPDGLTDEEFTGAVWPMRVPPAVLDLCADIEAYTKEAGKPSPYTSEAFAGYSYTKATDSKGAPLGWQAAFASRLKQWRKI